MKRQTIISWLPGLAAALSLCGCGGSAANASIGGTVSGLPDNGTTGVALVNNLADPIAVYANGSFTFDIPIQSGSTYSVSVTTQPYQETCSVTNGSGTVDQSGDAVTNVVVTCVPNASD